MSLIALPPDYLELNKRLPFGVFDAFGRLLVAAGQSVTDERKLALLRSRDLFVDDGEAGSLKESLQSTADTLIQHNATLEVIAAARMESQRPGRVAADGTRVMGRGSGQRAPSATPATPARRSLALAARPAREGGGADNLPVFDTLGTQPQRCNELVQALAGVLRDAGTDRQWFARLQAVREGLQAFAKHNRHAALYLLFQHAAHSADLYSCHHATLCALLCDAVAQTLGWAPEARDRITTAALCMNVSMSRLQDMLAHRDDPLRPLHKQQIAAHPQRTAEMLLEARVQDESLVSIVTHHHDGELLKRPLDTLDPAQRLTRLLITLDRFAARVSRRGTRHPMSPVLAARDLCNGPDGRPDEFGSAVLRAIGMYPPGSYVRLESEEVGVVLAPGRRLNQPFVAVFINARGMPTTEPLLRETALPGRAVREAVAVADINVRVNAEQVLKLAP